MIRIELENTMLKRVIRSHVFLLLLSLSLSVCVCVCKKENGKRTMGEGKDSKEVGSWGKGRIRIHVT